MEKMSSPLVHWMWFPTQGDESIPLLLSEEEKAWIRDSLNDRSLNHRQSGACITGTRKHRQDNTYDLYCYLPFIQSRKKRIYVEQVVSALTLIPSDQIKIHVFLKFNNWNDLLFCMTFIMI